MTADQARARVQLGLVCCMAHMETSAVLLMRPYSRPTEAVDTIDEIKRRSDIDEVEVERGRLEK